VIHVGARPLRTPEWSVLLKDAGFRVVEIGYAPMRLLRPRRPIQDEGVLEALRLAKNIVLDGNARRACLPCTAASSDIARTLAHSS
jgi:hypothetical protein